MAKGSGTRENIASDTRSDKIKRATVASVYVTALLVILLTILLLITLFTNHFGGGTNVIGSNPDTKGSFTLVYDDTKKGELLVINKTATAFDFTVNAESRLVSIADEIPSVEGTPLYVLRNADMRASKAALGALNKMIEDFYAQSEDKAAATKLYIWSAYRNLDTQNSLGTSTKGGYSDFHTGNLFEVTYGGSAASISQDNAYDWIYKNAYKYGFVTRYPEAKSGITGVSDFDNAFRYVGVAHATYMLENNLCLEEYVEKIRSHNESDPLSVTANGIEYSIYYVKANTDGETLIETSSKTGTSISGDNAGGFIVTVRK